MKETKRHIINMDRKDNLVRGFTCGAFDLLHYGHLLMLKEVREQCDFLIIGLQTDPSIDRPEKNKPIETVEERKFRLESCKYVDQIFLYDTEKDLYKLLEKLKPDVRFMGADWKDKTNYARDMLPEIKVIYNSRGHNHSSSNLRNKIKNS